MADRVALCIPTFRRPKMLARLLDAVAQLQTCAEICVLVADNDAQGHAGLDLCTQMRGYRWPLTAVIAEKRGIAQVRNVLVEEALKTRCRIHRHDRRRRMARAGLAGRLSCAAPIKPAPMCCRAPSCSARRTPPTGMATSAGRPVRFPCCRGRAIC